MGAVVAVNLAVISLPEMLGVAFGEEGEEEDQTKEEWAIPRLNSAPTITTITATEEAQPREAGV